METAVKTNRRHNLRAFMSVLRGVFDNIDSDRNGSLSRAEVADFVQRCAENSTEHRVAVFLARNFDFMSSISYIRAHTAIGEISHEDIRFLQALFSPRELEKLICLTPCTEHRLCTHFECSDESGHFDVEDMFEKRVAAERILSAF
jgi:hypothetical protein